MNATPPPRPTRRWPWFLGWLLLTVYFVTPPREAYDHSLDHSNYATYARFFAERAQWGEEVLPMTGPYGFVLYGHTYTDELFGLRFAGDLLLKAIFAALLLHLFRRAGPGGWRWAWLAGIVLIVPLVDDLFHDFAILLATLCLLADFAPRLNGWSRVALALLGFLALFKGTHLITASLCLGSVVLHGVLAGAYRAAAIRVAVYVAALVGCWIVAGQNPANLAGYSRAVLDLSSGYNATMGLPEHGHQLVLGLILAAGVAVLLALACAGRVRRPAALIPVLLLAGFAFIKWKHGFLRADGHVAIFFAAAGVIALTTALLSRSALTPEAAAATRPLRLAQLGVLTAVAVLSLLGTLGFHLELAGRVILGLPSRLHDNARFVLRPGLVRARLAEQLEANRREAHLPQVQNEVGRAGVDFFGHEQGILLLNRLRYQPRPMGGGTFNVFTARLQALNEEFVRDPRRAPAWQLMRLQSLDRRLPASNDPLTLRAVLEGYTPVLLQRDYLLLRRRAEPAFSAPRLIERRAVRPGERIVPPDPGPGQLLLFSVDAPLGLGGRLRSFLYRPPALTLRLEHARLAAGRDFAAWPVMLQQPAILSPLLIDNADVLELFGNGPGNPVRALELHPEPGYDASRLAIAFYAAPRPPAPEDTDLQELKTYIAHPLHNRPPVRIDAPPTGILELNKEPITSLHAPGSATWDLRPGDQQVIFSYGMMPRTWLEGDTDGVEFNVEVLWPPNDGRILFQHVVRPRTTPADQGMQRARVFLPPYRAGAQLRVRVHPGQDNNANYDQSYITRLQIKPGPLVAEQFSGLGLVPANGELPATAVAADGARPVYLVHAPGEVVVDVPAGARAFAADIGLLAGAYSLGGASDGVEFTATLLHPDGSRAVLARRLLNPRQVEADRGPQRWAFDLPGAPAGARLSIATGVGPNGDRGWDQSYVAGAAFR
ncbi:MAG TPA: hypothetical protein VEB66_03385 [Opitutaceae bacterium]|nr:hypothetical protein [Opitutaceae bacterium]